MPNPEPKQPDVSVKLDAPDFSGFSQNETLNNLDALVYATSLIKKPTATAPTYAPANFYDSIVFYDDGVNRRIYFYMKRAGDATPSASWHYTTLT